MINFKVGDVAKLTQDKRYTLFRFTPSGLIDVEGDSWSGVSVPAGTLVRFIEKTRNNNVSYVGSQVAQITMGYQVGALIILHEAEWVTEGFIHYNLENTLGNFPKKTKEEV
jgi:hypothetical protein